MSVEQLKRDLQCLGVKRGDILMMHSSYKSLGGAVTPDALFDAIRDVLGEEGTLVLPAFSYRSVTYDAPVFDRAQTPCCVGFLPEYFRTQVAGVVRSLHATHSCCVLGARAQELIADHELDETPVGANSPIFKIARLGGKILFLGCSPDHNTAMHGVEELADAPYTFDKRKRVTYLLRDGDRVVERPSYRHDFHKADCDYEQHYARIIPLLPPTAYTQGKVLEAQCILMSSRDVWEVGLAKMQQEPTYFVERVEHANV